MSPREYLTMSGDILVVTACVPVIWWVESRDAAKHTALHKTAPTTKNHVAQNVSILLLTKPGLKFDKRDTQSQNILWKKQD